MDTLPPQTPDLLELLYIFLGGAGLTAVVALINHWLTHRRQKQETEDARVLKLIELATDAVVKNYENLLAASDQRNEKLVAEFNRYRTQLAEVTDKWRAAERSEERRGGTEGRDESAEPRGAVRGQKISHGT